MSTAVTRASIASTRRGILSLSSPCPIFTRASRCGCAFSRGRALRGHPPAPGGASRSPCTFLFEAPTLSLLQAGHDLAPIDGAGGDGATCGSSVPRPSALRRDDDAHDSKRSLGRASELSFRLRVYVGATQDVAHQVVDSTFSVPIGTPGYYFEPTILFPTVFGGNRTIVGAPMVGGKEEILGVQQSNLGAIENVAVGLNIYPFGYPGSCINRSAWVTIFGICNGYQILGPFALQVGVAVANNAFRNYYVGAGYSVIKGVSLTAGAAFVQGQFFGRSIYPGEIVPISANGQIDGVETKYMVAPYFGVSISPAIINTIVQGVEGIKGLAPAHGSNGQED